jgi:hypothetical protein
VREGDPNVDQLSGVDILALVVIGSAAWLWGCYRWQTWRDKRKVDRNSSTRDSNAGR